MASTNVPTGHLPGNPADIPIAKGTIQVSADDSGTFVVLRVALFLTPDDALDLCLRTIGTVGRIRKGIRP